MLGHHHSFAKQIFRSRLFLPKVLLAALCIHTLIGIPVFIAYLHRFMTQVSHRTEVELPQWNEWLAMMLAGWELMVLMLAAAIPLVICIVFGFWFDPLLGWFGGLAWLPASVTGLLIPGILAVAYHQVLSTGSLRGLSQTRLLVERWKRSFEPLAAPTLMLAGWLFLGLPLFGLTTAIGLFLYLPFAVHAVETSRFD
jgi:hypothetical protein